MSLSHAATSITSDDIMSVWKKNGGNEINTEHCNVYLDESGTTRTLLVNTGCNFLHFSVFAFYKECEISPNTDVQIIGEGVSTSFTSNRRNCKKISDLLGEEQLVKDEIQSPIFIKGQDTTPPTNKNVNRKQYVIQFYAGSKPPKLKGIPCLIDSASVKQINGMYYVLSDVLDKKKAKETLSALKQKCNTSAWVRSYPLK